MAMYMAELPISTLFVDQSGIEFLEAPCGWAVCTAADHTTIDINDWYNPHKRTGDKGLFATVYIGEAEVSSECGDRVLPT